MSPLLFCRHPHALAAVASVLLLALGATSHAADSTATSPFPGLELVSSANVGKLYRRPDADLSEYSAILIGEPAVDFSKSWKPKNYSGVNLSAEQLKKIRLDVADLAKSTFAKVLTDGGYKVVDVAGDGVLEITPNILDLYINAPDVPKAGRSKTYVMDAGSMTLALQVNDAVTGTLLAVAFDKKSTGGYGSLSWATSVSNRAAAADVLTGWAKQLKTALDAARAK